MKVQALGAVLIFAVSAGLILASTEGWATPSEDEAFGKAAGTYMSAVIALDLVKQSKCGYALGNREFPPVDTVWTTEILPAFPPTSREQFAKMWPQLKERLTAALKTIEPTIGQNYAGDEKTNCGMEAGFALSIYKQYRDQWLAARMKYSTSQGK